MKKIFSKVLVANRGEIAVRILRALKELGIPSVTIYSDADRSALHTRYADEVYHIGKSPAIESYLNISKILEIAEKSSAEALHPGYGFLAENSEFAHTCEENGLIFIGPNSKAMKLLGDKTEARKTMIRNDIPVIPGTETALKDVDEAKEIADKIGYPVIMKAAGGGGGKGMRIIHKKEELESAFKTAVSEAQSAFNDPRIYLEKYLENARHIEFQVLADNYGNVVHLGERECSIQRRHQKMIEEAPSPLVDQELREKMGKVACSVVKASGYTNAGTVEFLVDKYKNFYFMEVNARLQVEHPVTELVTNIDIVKEQIKIALGEPLSLRQENIKLTGSAIECRISAEDPENNFIPSTGRIDDMSEPSGPGVRLDTGVYRGFVVPMFYDPLIAKLLVWAPTRQQAILRMKRALSEYHFRGIETTIPFHKKVMHDQRFVSGNYDTSFLEDNLPETISHLNYEKIAGIVGIILKETKERTMIIPKQGKSSYNKWKMFGRFVQNACLP